MNRPLNRSATQGRWARFLAYLTAEEDATPLALVRIACATTVVLHLGSFLLSGAADVALVHRELGGLSFSYGWFDGGLSVEGVHLLLVGVIVAAVFSALGLFSRPALLVTYLGYRAVSELNPSARGSYDNLLVDILFLLVLSGAGRALSIDARYRGKGGLTARWPRFLMMVQMGLLYFGSGIGKASSTWVPGGPASALWFILQQPTWARFPGLPLWAYPLTQIATTTTWIFEVSGLVFLFALLIGESEPVSPRLQRIKAFFARIRFVEGYLLFGLALHLGIELTMEVGAFSWASLALYPAALGPARVAKLRAWLASGPRRRG